MNDKPEDADMAYVRRNVNAVNAAIPYVSGAIFLAALALIVGFITQNQMLAITVLAIISVPTASCVHLVAYCLLTPMPEDTP